LYHRCKREDFEGGDLIHARIKHDGASVNWSKYSKPWDVIFDNPGEGIIQYIVANLPKEIPKEFPKNTIPKPQSFRPVHDPESQNYPHSEIWAFHGDVRTPASKLGDRAKKEFRSIMARQAIVLLRPSI
jgi:hypothetical protein